MMVQVPAPTKVTVEPETVQTVGLAEVNPTARPELVLAETVNGATPNVWLDKVPKVIVCEANIVTLSVKVAALVAALTRTV